MKVIFSLLVAVGAFIITFLAIFVPLLIIDMHYAPHNGQGGMGGFFLGLPIAIIVAPLASAYYYHLAKRRGWFSKST